MTDCREKLIGLRKCCTGHQWDERTEICKKCGSGYFGVNCGQSCDFPGFGVGCQGECKCSREKCNVSWGCPKKTTTTKIYTTKQSVVSTSNEKYYVTTTRTKYSTTSATTETKVDNQTSGPGLTQQLSPLDAFFTTQNLLIMAIFGVGLIFLTLLLGCTCRIIYKKIISKRKLNCDKKENRPDIVQDENHYEEISSILVVSNQGINYSPLLQNSTDGRDVTLERFNTSEEKENLEEFEDQGYENNAITKPTKHFPVDDPSDQELPGTHHELTDSEGYQLPHSSSTGMSDGYIDADFCMAKETPDNDRRSKLRKFKQTPSRV
ncbi:uncharacterized protein LOC125654500 isoform X3 [Ostrea edulis]|uniref:uncharacterized protein LOC125654500 isoform X3 n=1 Tax=Ostrea edulis TaxID=37623 RepID=UPI0024AF169D|nr:uncharacterized protein LOC125654500 isoform X3 [Ostrea edulis]XP_055998811.1 uncharacterized protein LOC125654500 isoform X3 [Ostrea edulis]